MRTQMKWKVQQRHKNLKNSRTHMCIFKRFGWMQRKWIDTWETNEPKKPEPQRTNSEKYWWHISFMIIMALPLRFTPWPELCYQKMAMIKFLIFVFPIRYMSVDVWNVVWLNEKCEGFSFRFKAQLWIRTFQMKNQAYTCSTCMRWEMFSKQSKIYLRHKVDSTLQFMHELELYPNWIHRNK